MHAIRLISLLAAITIAGSACASSAPGGSGSSQATDNQGAAAAQRPNRTVVIATRIEPTTLAPRALTSTGSSPTAPVMGIFNAWLVTNNGNNVPRPQLAERLPQLNTGDWQVFADGQMETTYHLRANLMWHDGTPLVAQDFIFGWQVFSNPDLGVRMDAPIRFVSDITAPDDRTLVVHWKQSYTDADTLGPTKNGGIPAMPRHLLEQKYRTSDLQAFMTDSYWSTGFIGSGPYRLERWVPGAFVEATAFDAFVEGRPQIERMKMVFTGDENAAVASLLSGDIHLAASEAISLEQASLLRKQWEASGAGEVIFAPNKARFIQIQFKDGYVNPRAILDFRVRKAFLEATDRLGLSQAIVDGQDAVADSIAGPAEEFYGDLQKVITKYQHNPQDAAALMSQAGFTKQSDGFYADPSGQRLSLELRAFPADPGPREAAILANQWKMFGADVAINVIPSAQSQDLEQVSAYPAFRIEQTGLTSTTPVVKLISSSIATSQNRWGGNNRGGWSNPAYDQLIDVFTSSLDREARNRAVIQAFKITADELPVLPLYYLPLVAARTAGLQGPVAGVEDELAWDNVNQWHWTR